MTTTADHPIWHLKDYGQSVWRNSLCRHIRQLGKVETVKHLSPV